jgi:hypothetical protein
MLTHSIVGSEITKRLPGAVDISFLNDGNSFPGIENLSIRKIHIENRSARGRVEIPVRFVSSPGEMRSKPRKSKGIRSMVYKAAVRISDNAISFVLLFVLKALQKVVNISCSKLEKYRVEMDYSNRKEEVISIKRLRTAA